MIHQNAISTVSVLETFRSRGLGIHKKRSQTLQLITSSLHSVDVVHCWLVVLALNQFGKDIRSQEVTFRANFRAQQCSVQKIRVYSQ